MAHRSSESASAHSSKHDPDLRLRLPSTRFCPLISFRLMCGRPNQAGRGRFGRTAGRRLQRGSRDAEGKREACSGSFWRVRGILRAPSCQLTEHHRSLQRGPLRKGGLAYVRAAAVTLAVSCRRGGSRASKGLEPCRAPARPLQIHPLQPQITGSYPVQPLAAGRAACCNSHLACGSREPARVMERETDHVPCLV